MNFVTPKTFKTSSLGLLILATLVACGDSGTTGSTEIPVAAAPAASEAPAIAGRSGRA